MCFKLTIFLISISFYKLQNSINMKKLDLMMRASLPLYHLPLMTLLVVLIFSINSMIYVLDQLQEHVLSYWNNR
jgi:hypothetical protein